MTLLSKERVNWPKLIKNGRKFGLTAAEAVALKKEQLRNDYLDRVTEAQMSREEREAMLNF